MQKVICLWSGGKDSCLAFYKAKKDGYKIVSLLNFISKGISRSHGLNPEILSYQANLIDIPIIQFEVEWGKYEEVFKEVINKLKESFEIEGVVFGDIYLEGHKEWADKICEELDIKQIMPLWKHNTKELLLEFINAGFEATIVSTRNEVMGREWLGCKINKKFLEKLSFMPHQIDPCGEEGEFHTLVTNGPFFKKPLQLLEAKDTLRDNRWYLEICRWQ
jgi:uncharacterized protein (TIGR00290 family)